MCKIVPTGFWGVSGYPRATQHPAHPVQCGQVTCKQIDADTVSAPVLTSYPQTFSPPPSLTPPHPPPAPQKLSDRAANSRRQVSPSLPSHISPCKREESLSAPAFSLEKCSSQPGGPFPGPMARAERGARAPPPLLIRQGMHEA